MGRGDGSGRMVSPDDADDTGTRILQRGLSEDPEDRTHPHFFSLTRRPRAEGPVHIALGPLDLDDVRTLIRQELRAERTGEGLRHVKHAHALQSTENRHSVLLPGDVCWR